MNSCVGQLIPYVVRFVDENGTVVTEQRIPATSYNAVLQELKDTPCGATRIEVFHEDGKPAGEVGVEYWQQRLKRRR